MMPQTTVGAALRSARTATGKSLNQVAVAVGISTATLSRIETEKQSVDVSLLMTIARELNVTIRDLITEDGERDKSEVLIAALASLPAGERVRIIAEAAKRQPARRPAEQLQSQVDTLLATVDIVRTELTELQRRTRRRH